MGPTFAIIAAIFTLLSGILGPGGSPAVNAQILGIHRMPTLPANGGDNIGGLGVGAGTRMVYEGGPVLTSVKVYIIYWNWTADTKHEAARLQAFFGGIGGSPWVGSQTQYCQNLSTGPALTGPTGPSLPVVGQAPVPYAVPTTALDCSTALPQDRISNPTSQLKGYWYDSNPVPQHPTDQEIANEAMRGVNHFGYDRNAEYIVATPHGHWTNGFAAGGGGWCAYHGAIGYANSFVSYTNLPYIPDGGTSCGANAVNLGTAGLLDGVTIVGGHEYAESLTDPEPNNAWSDVEQYENGDKCAWIMTGPGATADVTLSTGTFAVQSLWSNAANSGAGGCVLS